MSAKKRGGEQKIATGALTSIFWVSPAPTAVLTLDEQLTEVIFFPDTLVGATSKASVQATAFCFPAKSPANSLFLSLLHHSPSPQF
jgi:hypothetical protein